jgi:tetratricopeptide (TPR) repeat protein
VGKNRRNRSRATAAKRAVFFADARGVAIDADMARNVRSLASGPTKSPLSRLSRGRGVRALGGLAGIALFLATASGCAMSKNKKGSDSEDGLSLADKHYNVAVSSFQEGMYSDAKIRISRALEDNPDHARTHYLAGLIELHEGKTMIDAIENQTCLNDEGAARMRSRADEHHRAAYESFKKSSETYGENEAGRGRALNSMAVVSLHFQKNDRAIEEAKQALEIQFYTERYSALSNMGWAYYNRGEMVEAMTELRQAIMMNNDYCVAHYRLATVYLDMEMDSEALEEITAVIENPRCPIQDAHRLYGVANMRLGRSDTAGAAFEACMTLAPRSCLANDCAQFLQLAAAGAPAHSP